VNTFSRETRFETRCIWTLLFLIVSHPVENRGDEFESYRPDQFNFRAWMGLTARRYD